MRGDGDTEELVVTTTGATPANIRCGAVGG
jgi:hypothetical protein